VKIGRDGRGHELRFGDGAADFVGNCACTRPVVCILMRRRCDDLKRFAPAIGGDSGKPLLAGVIVLSERIDDGIRGTQAHEQTPVARAACSDGDGISQRLNVVVQTVQDGKQIPLRFKDEYGFGGRKIADDERRGARAGGVVAP
jgi:hypothetical protein